MEGNGGKNDAGLTRHVEEDDARVLAHFVVSRAPVEGVDLSFLNLQGARDFLGGKPTTPRHWCKMQALLLLTRARVYLQSVICVVYDSFHGAVASAVADGSPACTRQELNVRVDRP